MAIHAKVSGLNLIMKGGYMTPTEALREMLDRSGTSMYALSKAMGKSPTYIQSTIRQGSNLGAGNLALMASHMGFKLTLNGMGEPIEITERSEDADDNQRPADQR